MPVLHATQYKMTRAGLRPPQYSVEKAVGGATVTGNAAPSSSFGEAVAGRIAADITDETVDMMIDEQMRFEREDPVQDDDIE